MHVILTRATDLVGSSVLKVIIKNKQISKISDLGRRPVPMAADAKETRIHFILHRDFANYDANLLEKLEEAQGCMWALGVS